MKGTIMFVGKASHETSLLASRLEAEHYEVVHVTKRSESAQTLNSGVVQAILLDHSASRFLSKTVITLKNRDQRTRHLPVILLAEETPPKDLQSLKAVGEVFRLHTQPLYKILQRLQRAIQLCQLVRL